MNDFAEQGQGMPLKPAGTSKLAIAAGLSCTLCPFVGSPLGFIFGLLALLQIRASGNELGGATMAWLGVVAGLGEMGGAAAMYNYRETLIASTPQVVQGFMAGVAKGDLDAAHDFMTDGLRPTLDRGRVDVVGKALREALGDFDGLGERRSHDLPLAWPIVLEVEHALTFSKGAPAVGKFFLTNEYGQMKVTRFVITSPVLRPGIDIKGKASQELGGYDGPQERAGTKIKKFK